MFFLVLLGYKAKPQTQKNFLLLSCILWIIIWGLRGLNVGNDTNGYAMFFEGTATSFHYYGTVDNPEESLELGFTSLAKFLNQFSNSSVFFFLVEALLCYIAIFQLYKNNSYGLWGFLLFNIMTSCSLVLNIAVRQCFSISFLLISICIFKKYEFSIKNKWKLLKDKYFILAISCFLFALFIHRASFLFLPFILIAYWGQLKRKMVYAIIFSVLVITIIIPNVIIEMFDLILSQILFISSEKVNVLASRYADDLNTDSTFLGILSWCIPMFLTTYFTSDKKINTFDFKCLIIGFIFVTLLSGSTMQARLSLLFLLIGSKMLIPSNIEKRKFLFVFYMSFTIFKIYTTYSKYANWNFLEDSVLPYSFFWE